MRASDLGLSAFVKIVRIAKVAPEVRVVPDLRPLACYCGSAKSSIGIYPPPEVIFKFHMDGVHDSAYMPREALLPHTSLFMTRSASILNVLINVFLALG